MRICARSGCSSPAVAILTYDRDSQTAYLYSVDDPSTRTPGDLCERHLSRFVVPRSWHLDDRRDGAAPVDAAHPEPLRAVPEPRATTTRATTTRATTTRATTRRKWAAAEPSLFDAPATDAVAQRGDIADAGAPVTDEPAATEPVWMPRFGPDSELDGVLDAKTPLLRRAFGGR
jgi:Protein of unknown function (DUF3499)